ncbi:unnamed protein product [Medioppia subpectinata]|uniref:Tetraspanin n=1 Tax=Medioppia subpectinata TaxID=1979941 RepID=A0A7R9LGP0_9ACAR|nr:unnamed protein product [Medioppia subpectinata]CAG2118071.1 unnamed protein product [Medioppia subpectinata]
MITLFSIFGLKCNERLLKILYEFNPDIKTIRKCFAINGFLIIINSLFGLTAIYRKRLSILIAFCFILIGLFVFTLFSIVVGTISYHNLANQSPSRAVDTFSGLMNEYDWKGINNSSGRLVDEFQLQFNCCGSLNGSHSWEPLRPTGVPIGAYPLSCCLNDVKYDLDNQWCDEQQVYQKVTVSYSQNFNRDYVGVAYSPYTKHWVGKQLPYWNSYTLQDIKDMLNVVNSRFRSIATYGMGVAAYNANNKWDETDSNCLVSRAAAQINRDKNQNALIVAQGINQIEDNSLQQKEINNAFSAAQDANGIHGKTVWGLTFTNEYFTNEATGNRILNMITSNKKRAHDMGLKVGTRIHVCGIIHNSGSMRDILANIVRESDFIMCKASIFRE